MNSFSKLNQDTKALNDLPNAGVFNLVYASATSPFLSLLLIGC